MSSAPGIALAFAAGVVSFVSPCCLPLVPGYLATITRPRETGAVRSPKLRVLGRSLLFVGTFSMLFILLGLSTTAAGAFLTSNQRTLNTVAGIAIVFMGLLFIGSVFAVRLNRQWRPQLFAAKAVRGGPVLAGAAFAIAWTPCVGPTLGAILGLAATQHGSAHGGLLLAFYSAGLALPFLFSALAFDAASRTFGFFKRHYAAVQVASGTVLVGMGVLVLTGDLFRLNIAAQHLLDRFGLNFFQSL